MKKYLNNKDIFSETKRRRWDFKPVPNGFISLIVLTTTVTLTTILSILMVSIKTTNHTLRNAQHYTQAFFTADAALKLSLSQLENIPQLATFPKKQWCYDHYPTGHIITPFQTTPVSLFQYKSTAIAITHNHETRLILLGKLNPSHTQFTHIYAYD